MKKQISGMIFAAALLFGSVASVFAQGVIPDERQLPRLVDEADILDTRQEARLEAELDRVSEEYQCDVAVVTTTGTNNRGAQAYADDFYDYNGYGMGEGDDGILLLVDMYDREWAISTYGFGIEAFTDDGLEYIADEFLPYLGDDQYYEAFQAFTEQCGLFLNQARNGEPFHGENMPKESMPLIWLPVSILIGTVLSLIVTGIMRYGMKTVRRQTAAAAYMKPGSMHLTVSRDLFLYSKVDRVAKPKDNSSGGGGSSVHTSSSGRSHGGSSGSF